MSGIIWMVPTPIGNLDDMTFRAVQVLKSVDVILAEDTRTSGNLMRHFEISTPMKSLHMHNEHQSVGYWVAQALEGKHIAVVTDAGTPGISDPGFLLVREAIAKDVNVQCLPGATALIPAVVISGLPNDEFVFIGFLPQKKGRQTAVKSLLLEQRTTVLYESPHRIHKLLDEIIAFGGGNRLMSISREISKKFEETMRGTASDLAAQIKGIDVKGEIVVVVGKELQEA